VENDNETLAVLVGDSAHCAGNCLVVDKLGRDRWMC
jgi:hypothetical protein